MAGHTLLDNFLLMNFIVKFGFIAAAGLLTACSSQSSYESQGEISESSYTGFFSSRSSQKNLESKTIKPANMPVNVKNIQVSRTTDAANEVLITAMGLVGTPYRWGGESEKTGFDCSGLIQHVFADTLDMDLPRRSVEMSRMQGKNVAKADLKTGDLVFFSTDKKRKEINHVGIFVGDGRFVHAPRAGRNVTLSKLDTPYWQKTFREAKRVITPKALALAKVDIR